MYQDFSYCSKPSARNVAGCPTDSDREMLDAVGGQQRGGPRDAGPPVVAHHVSAIDAPAVVKHSQHVDRRANAIV